MSVQCVRVAAFGAPRVGTVMMEIMIRIRVKGHAEVSGFLKLAGRVRMGAREGSMQCS